MVAARRSTESIMLHPCSAEERLDGELYLENSSLSLKRTAHLPLISPKFLAEASIISKQAKSGQPVHSSIAETIPMQFSSAQ